MCYITKEVNHMKKRSRAFVFTSMLLLSGRDNIFTKNVVLTFMQHSFIKLANDGYYFKDDEIVKSDFCYDKGFYLDSNEIDSLYTKVNYVVPSLNGDGYFSLTFFTKNFDSSTGYSSNYLEPLTLNSDMVIHFAIIG